MNRHLVLRRERLYDPRVYPVVIAIVVAFVVTMFYVLGFRGDLRWIKLLIGMTVVAVVATSRLSTAIGVFLLATIFPTFIVIGPTNFVLVVLLFVSWLARAAHGDEARPSRTPCDVPLLLLTLAYVISWVNVPRESFPVQQAWYYSQNHIGSLMIFYMTYAAVREERDARILVRFMQILAAFIYLGAVVEIVTGVSITGLGRVRGAQYTLGGGVLRAGGVLGSHDMLADFCSMNIGLHLYLLFTRRGALNRLTYGTLVVLCVVAMFMTSNRGGIVGFSAGLFYLGLLLWRTLGAPALVGAVSGAITLFLLVDQILSRTGKTLSVFYRLARTRFYGVVPETRVGVVEHLRTRIAEHPWLGEGPYYRLTPRESGEFVFWPHNAFAYYWATVGILGMVAFVVLVAQVLVHSWRERARQLGEGWARELLLILHVMVVVLLITQQRTDFQRGFVFTYYVFFVFGFTMGVWRLARAERLAAAPSAGEAG